MDLCKMKFAIACLALFLFVQDAVSAPAADSEDSDGDDVDWDEGGDTEDAADDDGRVYKNPRNSPSAQCPRDEDQATLLGQKCLRKCSSDEDCKSKKKKCLCDGACGMSCIKPDRECPELEQPEVGTVSITGRLFGDRATYTCPHGTHVVGLQNRNCQADGQWAGQAPSCKQNIYCLSPPTIEHARHSALPEQATFDLDATVQYHCHTGYVTNGFPRAKCLAIDNQASWYGPDISCEPRSCGPPGDVPHGWVTAECHSFGCRALLQCGAGFELVGKAERFCQADGSWAPKELPTCVLVTAVQCAPPEAPRHGKAVYTSCAYNSVVSYECKYGYRLVGDSTRRCGADKKWSGTQPVCKEINCGHPGRLWNGWLENIEAGTGLGASIIFRCHEGMKMEGNSSTVCQIDGTWRYPLPKCLAPCVVPHVTQGNVKLVDNYITTDNGTTGMPTTQVVGTSTMVQHGDLLVVECEKNYEFPSTGSSVTCNNGTWTHIPRCQPARCKKLPKPPRNGMVIAPKTDHGMRSKFRCKDGFELHGPNFVTCSFGNWTGETPVCQEVYCPFPGYIEHGKVLLVGNMGLYDYRPYVRKVVNNKQIMYDCDKGYVLNEGAPGATCIGGVWRPEQLPRCTLGQHPRLRWSRRRRSIQPTLLRHRRATFIRKYYHDLRKRSAQTQNPLRHTNSKLQERIDKRDESDDPGLEYVKNIPRNVYIDSGAFDGSALRQSSGERARRSDLLMRLGKSFQSRIRAAQFLENYYIEKRKGKSSHRRKRDAKIGHIPKQTSGIPETMYQMKLKALALERKKKLIENSTMSDDALVDLTKSESNLSLKEFFNTTSGNDTEAITARKKRTSRKTDRQNQTTATVPKSGRDGKGTKGQQSNYPAGADVAQEEDLNSKNGTESIPDEVRLANRKNGRPKAPCDVLASEPYVNIEIVKHGRDANISYSAGTVVRVACGKGYGLNLGNNNTAKCVRGRWKPATPICEILPCHIPVTDYGIYSVPSADSASGLNAITPLGEGYKELNVTDDVKNGQVVHFSCEYGYNVQGPSNLRCWHGEWAVTSLPECIPAPCELPPLRNAGYESGYRAGLTIAHDSSVGFHCDTGYTPGGVFNCHLGRLQPSVVDFCSPAIGSNTSRGHVSEYTSGSDIVKEDVSDLEDAGFGNTNCGPPARVQGTLIYRDGSPINGSLQPFQGYQHGTEVTFRCIASIMGERTTWKIICENGNWIGKSANCDDMDISTTSAFGNETCMFRNEEPNVVSFYNDLEVKEEVVDFPPGSVVVTRCVDIGKYAMTGSGRRRCINGEWDGVKPSCFGLNQENDYAMEKPPTILFRHQLGPIAQSNDGKLIVYPGTILHMECLWMRRFGNPKWEVSHEYRKYPEGWSTDPGRDSQLEYRLSIFHATKDDSGMFTCVTPARQSHQVEIIVEAVHCPALPLRKGLISSSQSTKMGSEVSFTCANGNSLLGSTTLQCQPSGNWSAPLPLCESVECGEVVVQAGRSGARPRVAVVSRGVGGRAAFSCPPGWGLRGPTETVCLPSGDWGKPFPTCVEVSCPAPSAPLHGAALGRAPFRAGDVVQFSCGPARAMEGRPIAACQDNARWSAPTPKCVQACPYPGTTISGRMSAVKFYYKIGETITFSCEPGLQLRGAPMLRCLRNGKWSNAIPLCSRLSALNETSFLTDNEELAMLSDSSISAGLRNAAATRVSRTRAFAFKLRKDIAKRTTR